MFIAPPEAPGAPFRLNAHFMDAEGKTTLCIVDNEWKAGIDNWDVETVKNRIFIRQASCKIVLVLRTKPPETFYIEKLDMATNGYTLKCDGGAVFATMPGGCQVVFEGEQYYQCHTVVALGSQTIRFGMAGPPRAAS